MAGHGLHKRLLSSGLLAAGLFLVAFCVPQVSFAATTYGFSTYGSGLYGGLEAPDTAAPVISSISSGTPSDTGVTITWTTDEAASSTINYGLSTTYGTASTSATLVTSHSITLAGLSPSTTYHYRVGSQDAAGNVSTSTDRTFITSATPDVTAPTISSISSGTPGDTAATITWTTNEAADSQLAFGTTASYGATTTLDTTLVTSHSVGLSSLSAATVYHFRIRTADGSGNIRYSADQTFTTASTVDSTAPSVSVTAPTNGATISGASVAVSATAADNVAVAGVSFYVDGVRIGSEDTSSTYGVTLDSTVLSNASHVILAAARDTSNNYATSSSITVTVNNTVPDTTAPVLSAVSAGTPSDTTATITWTTNEAANSRVDYGTTVSYSDVVTAAPSVTSHSVTLSGLTANTTYHFRVQSADASSNVATSGDLVFTTAIAAAVSPDDDDSSTRGRSQSTASPSGTTGGYSVSPAVISLIITYKDLFIAANAQGMTLPPFVLAILGLTSTPSVMPSSFSHDLESGAIDEDVHALQKYLNTHGYPLATSGPGSPGNETNIFGPITKAALARFQAGNGIAPAAGYFGPKTRAFVASHP